MKNKPPKLLDAVREKMTEKKLSQGTQSLYINWIKRYVIFHKKVHPLNLDMNDITVFLNYIVEDLNLSHSTQRQAAAGIFFLYREVLKVRWLLPDKIIWVNKPMVKKEVVSNKIKTKSNGQKLKAFLCHANEDKPVVRKLYSRLKKIGVQPWLDDEDLIGGQEWELEIEKAVSSSDIVIVCLSNKSITKTGFVQKEIKFALDIADHQPENSIFIIPIRLEECVLPTRLKKWQAIDSFRSNGFDKLKKSLNKRALAL
ncbi:MAG: TIR domain-containing protein [Bacteroidia bacterium]|nr:TIR domain-containing protein [Bacteroidia bacterium]